jgi:hypothetical protein
MWTHQYESLGNWIVTNGDKELQTQDEGFAIWLASVLNTIPGGNTMEVACSKCGEYFELECDDENSAFIYGVCPECGEEAEHERTA